MRYRTALNSKKENLKRRDVINPMNKIKNPENFEADIHVVDYRAQFEEFRKTSADFISIDGRVTESLNGEWNFMTDPYESLLRGGWYKEITRDPETGLRLPLDYDYDQWPTIKVPSTWNTERPDLFLYENAAIYTRKFRIIPNDDERIFLHFEGVSYRAYVFLNGVCVGMHDGASTPFTCEVTDIVKNDEDNRLIVFVDASRSDKRVPMSNTDWFNYGGLYRDVHIVRTPKAFVNNYFIRLVKGTYDRIAFDVVVNGEDTGVVTVEIPELGIKQEVSIKNGNGNVEFDAKPILWSPENPKLYDVTVSFAEDSVTEKIGFKEIRVEGRKILLNGEEVFMKGISCHEDHITLGKTTDEATIRETIDIVKNELHGRFIRIAHYPHNRLFSRIADEMGILLWEEIPVYWAIAFDDPKTYADAANQLEELIIRDRNRASVAIWSVGNENPDTDERFSFMSRLAEHARELDPTRPISAACLVNGAKEKIEDRLAAKLDIIGLNEYYGWYRPDIKRLSVLLANSNPDKPVIVTEFGAGARAGHHGSKDEMWTEEYQEEIYRQQTEQIAKTPFIQGMSPWILYDFRAVRRLNKYQDGWNRKGLIASDRKTRKLAFKVLSDFYGNIK